MRELTIKRSEWLRGEGPSPSRLLRETDRKRCCLGILGRSLGIPDEDLEEARTPIGTKAQYKDTWPFGVYGFPTYLPVLRDILHLNDAFGISAEDREEGLKEAFLRLGITLTFEE